MTTKMVISMDRKVNFEWYVLNEETYANGKFNEYPYSKTKKIKPFNIFRNSSVYESTIRLCEEYEAGEMDFNDFVEELRRIIQWQEWARCEYEIYVCGRHTIKDENDLEKIDCYMQALPNIEIISRYVLYTYREETNKDVK